MKNLPLMLMALALLVNGNTLKADNPMEAHICTSVTRSVDAKAVHAAEESTSIITKAEGVAKYYIRNTNTQNYAGYNQFLGGVSGELVFDESTHTVYMKNPQTALRSDTYIVGSYTDTSLSFTMPQTLDTSYYGDLIGHRFVKDSNSTDNNEPTYTIDDSEPLTYTIAADGTITMNSDGDKILFGFTDAFDITYANYETVFTPFNDKALTMADMPDDFASKVEMWCMQDDSSKLNLKVVNSDNKLYIAGFDTYNPDSFVVGDIDGNTVTFKAGQYTGINRYLYQYSWFYGYDGEKLEDAVFSYAPEAGVLSNKNSSFGLYSGDIVNNRGITELLGYSEAAINRVPSDISLIPNNPTNLYISSPSENSTSFSFILESQSKDGWPLNDDNLYYRIYFNKKLFTFTKSDYPGLDSDCTDMRYKAAIYDDNGNRVIGSYSSGYNYIEILFNFATANAGIQAVYKDGDTEYCSDIVYFQQIPDLVVNDIAYNITSNGTVEVTYGDNAYTGDIEIPAKITDPETNTEYTVTTIGDKAFFQCTELTSITLPESITSIGDRAFAFCYYLKSINFPNGLTTIADRAFYKCYSLTDVTIPEAVTKIGTYAFADCVGFVHVTIPESVKELGSYAFTACSLLETVDIKAPLTELPTGVLYNSSSLVDVNLPKTLTSLGESAFEGCTDLTEITLPASVTKIDPYAFADCASLTNITIPAAVTTIGELAFYNCRVLPSITIPNNVTTIGYLAFALCLKLPSITIPAAVTSIDDKAFAYCDALKTVTSLSTTPPAIGETIFATTESIDSWFVKSRSDADNEDNADSENADFVIYVPAESVSAYQAQWSDYADYITAIDSTTGIGAITVEDNAVVECYNLQGMRIKSVRNAADLQSLTPGIYIVNGKKVIVK
jgi:hypothetical protein